MNADKVEMGAEQSKEETPELQTKMEAPLTLYMYAREDQFRKIINDRRLRLSTPWATNDVTEGVAQGETERSSEREKYGYICLSASCTSPSLWGYYAGSSTGVCLAFTFYRVSRFGADEGRIDGSRQIFRVKYQKERGKKEEGNKLMCIKSTEWLHEKEFRMLFKLSDAVCKSDDNNVSFYTEDLNPHLTGVILGCKCKLKEVQVEGMLKAQNWLNPHLGAYPFVKKARLSNTDFEMEVDEATLEQHQRDWMIIEVYKRIDEFARITWEQKFHDSYVDDFLYGHFSDSSKAEDYVCQAHTYAIRLISSIVAFMSHLKSFGFDKEKWPNKVKSLYRCFDDFAVVKEFYKNTVLYIKQKDSPSSHHICNLLLKKLLYAQHMNFSTALLNAPIEDWPKPLTDLTILIYLSLVGDCEFPPDYKDPECNWLLWLCRLEDAPPKYVQDALLCAMRGWNANPRDVGKTVNEIISILEQSAQTPS